MRLIGILRLLVIWMGVISLGAYLTGCSAMNPGDPMEDSPLVLERVFSFSEGYEPQPSTESLLHAGVLLLVQTEGLVALDAQTGEVKWRFKGAPLSTRPVVVEDTWVVFPELPRSGWNNQSLWVLKLDTGEIAGRLRLRWPEDLDPPGSLYGPFIWETWIAASGPTLYMPLSYLPPTLAPVKYRGIFRFTLEKDSLQADRVTDIHPQLLLSSTPYQELTARPAFTADRAYFFLNGSNVELPDSEPRNEDNFRRSDVRLVAWSLSQDRELWSRGFSYLGHKTWNPLTVQEGRIYLGDFKALACVESSDGTLVWEKGVAPWDGSFYFSDMALRVVGDRVFSTVIDNFHCFSAFTGELQWSFEEPLDYTLDSNGEVFGSRVYLATPTGLKVFDTVTGRLVGEDTGLKIPGYRIQGIMPRGGDMLYLLRNEELVAVRMGSENR